MVMKMGQVRGGRGRLLNINFSLIIVYILFVLLFNKLVNHVILKLNNLLIVSSKLSKNIFKKKKVKYKISITKRLLLHVEGKNFQSKNRKICEFKKNV